jgi:hypothetical protein
MIPSEEEIRALKSQGMSDNDIGDCFGLTGGKVKNLRFKYNIPSPRLEVTRDKTVDLWPAVMSESARSKHWARYFERLGHDHSHDDLRFKPTGRVMPQPDRSHWHNLGATSLKQMESF